VSVTFEPFSQTMPDTVCWKLDVGGDSFVVENIFLYCRGMSYL